LQPKLSGPKRRLGRKIIAGYIVAAVLLILLISFMVGQQYWTERMGEYNNLAFSYADIAAEYIDGDRVKGYLETGEQDDYYWQVMEFLSIIHQRSNLEYYYVYAPAEDHITYLWSAEIRDALGQTDLYDESGKALVEALFRGEPQRDVIISRHPEYGYLATANVAVYDSAGEPVAVVGVDLSMPGILDDLKHFIAIIVACVVGVVLVGTALSFGFIRRSIIRPISLLSAGAKSMVDNLESGNAFTVDIHTGDEIEELAHSFSQMDEEIRAYIERLSVMTAEKERIGAELSVATQIQADMLPRIYPAFPQRDEFDIYATMTPAKEVGGDFYDFFMVDDDHLMLVIADVSGKGVPAALFMVITKTLLKNSAEQGLSPKAIFEKVNNQLCENNDEGMFVTVWMGMLEISTGRLLCANAGHEDPILIRDGKAEQVRQKHGLVMAYMEDAPYREQEIQLQPGDAIFVFTDGVTEATSGTNELYGRERLLATLNHAAGGTPEALLAAVKADVGAFVAEAPQFDDITMLSLQIAERSGGGLEELKTEPIPDNLYQVTGFVEDTLGGLGVPMKALMQINVAVDEIYSNIARCSGATELTVACGVQNGRAVVRFSDNGVPYDPMARPEPDTTLPLEERGEGGLGIHIVKKTMDSVSYAYRAGYNVLSIEKAW